MKHVTLIFLLLLSLSGRSQENPKPSYSFSLEQAISLHESRLSKVRVALEPQRDLDRALRFRIDALMELGTNDEKVQFDAVLQLNTQTYMVR